MEGLSFSNVFLPERGYSSSEQAFRHLKYCLDTLFEDAKNTSIPRNNRTLTALLDSFKVRVQDKTLQAQMNLTFGGICVYLHRLAEYNPSLEEMIRLVSIQAGPRIVTMVLTFET